MSLKPFHCTSRDSNLNKMGEYKNLSSLIIRIIKLHNLLNSFTYYF